jgi:RimJ/RimL family protein N-acetyltransferase
MYYLRDVQDEDHEWLVELHNDPLVLKNLTDPRPITMESHMAWWNSLNQEKNPRKIFCLNNDRIGFCKIYNIDASNKNCLLGADIHESHRGNGHAKIMWLMMLEYCFGWPLELHRVSLTTAEYNSVARRVYKKVGFATEGIMVDSLLRDGEYHDQICMYMTKDMWKRYV